MLPCGQVSGGFKAKMVFGSREEDLCCGKVFRGQLAVKILVDFKKKMLFKSEKVSLRTRGCRMPDQAGASVSHVPIFAMKNPAFQDVLSKRRYWGIRIAKMLTSYGCYNNTGNQFNHANVLYGSLPFVCGCAPCSSTFRSKFDQIAISYH